MRPIAVADSETDPFKMGRIPQPFIWGYYDGNTYEEFDRTIDFINFVYDKEIILYAHNGGKFDWHFILDFIEPFTPVSIINGRIAKFKIGSCEFRDSFNILPTALSAFAKEEFDYALMEPEEREKPHNKKKIQHYLYKDCVYLYEYITGFIDRFGMTLTQASAAMKQWKQISGLEPPNDDGGFIYENFKQFYFGGRCQSFEYGIINDDFCMVDINSAYPYAMLSMHPYGTDHYEMDEKDFHRLTSAQKGTCFMVVTAISGGALPFRGDDNSLYFPDDSVKRTYRITGWEYLAALDTNTAEIFDITEIWYFPEQTDFSKYIMHFYEQRKVAKQTGDKAGNIFCKLLMNSLYGKFGSNPDEYRNYETCEEEYLNEDGEVYDSEKDRTWHFAGDFGPLILISSELYASQKRYYNVATAASITGFVRAYLWRAICGCDGVLYCDTDSIAARNVRDLPNGYGVELGQWEKEGEFTRAALAGRKLYCFEKNANYEQIEDDSDRYKTACKGVRLTPHEIIEVAKGKEIVYEPEAPVFSVHKEPHFMTRRVKMVKKELQN